jgi:ATP-dependent Clp protease ATP-binding subunit ClpB
VAAAPVPLGPGSVRLIRHGRLPLGLLFQLEQLQQRLADRRITLVVTEAATAWLVERGFDPIYGARPLRRLVQTAVGDSLAKGILSGEIRDGQTVTVDAPAGASALTVS